MPPWPDTQIETLTTTLWCSMSLRIAQKNQLKESSGGENSMTFLFEKVMVGLQDTAQDWDPVCWRGGAGCPFEYGRGFPPGRRTPG